MRTPGITDSRVDTFCRREAIRQKYAGKIDVASFNAALADGEGLESAMADLQSERAHKKRSATRCSGRGLSRSWA